MWEKQAGNHRASSQPAYFLLVTKPSREGTNWSRKRFPSVVWLLPRFAEQRVCDKLWDNLYGPSATALCLRPSARQIHPIGFEVFPNMHADVSFAAAFLAGLVSFLSPCVLPLVPGYISMLSGVGMEQLRQGQQPRGGLFASALSFVVGFSVVFISFGASASAVGSFLRENRTLLAPIAGALIILFGLHLLGWLIKLATKMGIIIGAVLVALGIVSLVYSDPLFFKLGAVHFFSLSVIGFFGPTLARWLNRDVHLRSSSKQPGIWSGFLLGFAFAFGWTPCIGPILATVLALAAASETIFRGVLLLAAYSAGLAIPFLLTAVGIGQFLKFYQRFRKHLHAVEVFSGALLLFVGALIFVNRLTWLAGKLSVLNTLVLWLEHALTGGK
jgi:cytochrome c-type biogenesis protein